MSQNNLAYLKFAQIHAILYVNITYYLYHTMAAKERVVSERVVSSRVIGSSNPIARKFREFKGKIGGICAAPILIIIAFVLLFGSERIAKKSAVVENLELEKATEVTADDGMHKIQGIPIIENAATAPELGTVLYYDYEIEEYREVEETETETVTRIENGKEIEDTVERTKLVEKWVEEESGSKWGSFSLGEYIIEPDGAKMELDLSTKTYYEDMGMYVELGSGRSVTPDLGDRRLVVNYLPLDDELVVVGEVSGTTISGGDVFIISNKSAGELVDELKSEENMFYWVMKVGSWVLFTVGILSLLGPILALVDFIPLVGKSATCAASVVAAIIAAGIVLAGTIVIKYWFICLALLLLVLFGGIAFAVILMSRKSKAEGVGVNEKEKE